jgi:hypothetical protein
VSIPLTGPLDQFTHPARGPRTLLQRAENIVYRRLGALGKRTGSGPYGGNGIVGTGLPVVSGYRWYRGSPSPLARMVVQSGNQFYVGHDGTGNFDTLGMPLPAGCSPAYFCSAYNPNEHADNMIVTFGQDAPRRWDGSNAMQQLSQAITNPFTGCYSWHNHVWFWGDPNFPTTVFATDLGNPTSYTFSMDFGGYQQGRGDGDPFVKGVIDTGSVLYVFKRRNIYAIQGYDFVQGDYPFSDQPLVTGIGTPNGKSLAILDGNIIFWDGQQFRLLPPGSNQAVPIGTPIINAIALAATGTQSIISAVAGDFLVQGPLGPIVYNDVYLCAVDMNQDGQAETILMFDNYASQMLGQPAWTIFTGLNIGCFIPWGGSGDQRILYYGDGQSDHVHQFGQNAMNDTGGPITVKIQTLQDDAGTPDQNKQLDRVFLELEATAATFQITAIMQSLAWAPQVAGPAVPDQTISTEVIAAAPVQTGAVFGTAIFGQSLFGGVPITKYQSAVGNFNGKYAKGRNVTFVITESSAETCYEIVGLTWHCQEEAYAA